MMPKRSSRNCRRKYVLKRFSFVFVSKATKFLFNSFFYVIPQGYENEEEEELDVVEGLEALVGVIFLLLLN